MTSGTGFLTTHILDTANGCPAANVKIELFRLAGSERSLLTSMITNDDGRTDSPILETGQMTTGTYELVFHIGDYFANKSGEESNSFIDVVPVRFGVNDEAAHYHVPLLVSPYSYSTYRGS